MIQRWFARFFLGTLASGLAALYISCNDMGTSPYAPHIFYKTPGVAAVLDSALTPDTLVSDSGAVTSAYSISPALPAGLVLDPQNGTISGKATVLYAPTYHTVTGTGPNGIARTVVNICVGDSSNSCNIQPPGFTYFPEAGTIGPGFMWSSPNVAFSPDTPTSTAAGGGIVTNYSVYPPLPSGVSLNPLTGVISGTPTDTMTAMEYNVVATGPFGPPDTAGIYIGVYPSSFPFPFLQMGEARFAQVCADCHGTDAKGARCPPLYHSDFLIADRHRPVRLEILGLYNFVDTAKTIVINGMPYVNYSMPNEDAPDSEIASVLTFIRTYFNGAKDYISLQEVSQVRDSLIAVATDTSCAGGQCYIGPH